MADSSDGIKCRCCSEAIGDSDNFFVCGGVCGGHVHLDCTQMNKHALNAVIEFENIIFLCDECTTNSIKTINNKVDGIYAILNRLEKQMISTNEMVKEIKGKKSNSHENDSDLNRNSKNKDRKSYADVLKPKRVVLVKPKDSEKTDSKKTKESVRKNIDPTTIKVNALTSISNGGVAIECGDEESVEKIKKKLAKMSEEFTCEEAKQRKYRIKIVGIRDKLENDEIIGMLMKQNDCFANDSELKIIRAYNVKDMYYSALVEMNKNNFDLCIESGSVRIGWDKCKVYEEIPLTVCVKCCGYYHIAKECKNANIVCRKCGGSHKMSECKEKDPKCINCMGANEKHGFKFDVAHTVNDSKCEVRKQKIEMVRRRMNRVQ